VRGREPAERHDYSWHSAAGCIINRCCSVSTVVFALYCDDSRPCAAAAVYAFQRTSVRTSFIIPLTGLHAADKMYRQLYAQLLDFVVNSMLECFPVVSRNDAEKLFSRKSQSLVSWNHSSRRLHYRLHLICRVTSGLENLEKLGNYK